MKKKDKVKKKVRVTATAATEGADSEPTEVGTKTAAAAAAGSQAAAASYRRQQQQPQAKAGEKAAAAEGSNGDEQNVQLRLQNVQLSKQLHEESVRVQGFLDAAAQAAQEGREQRGERPCDSRITKLNMNSAGVSTAVYNMQKAQLNQFWNQRNAEKVRRQVAVDIASPKVKQELDEIQRRMNVDVFRQKLDEIRRMMNVDGLLSMNGEAQAMKAQFDGADGEAAPSADFLDELED